MHQRGGYSGEPEAVPQASGNRHFGSQIRVLNRVLQCRTFFDGTLERLASGGATAFAGPLPGAR